MRFRHRLSIPLRSYPFTCEDDRRVVGWHHLGASGYSEKRRRTSISDSPYLRTLKNKTIPLNPYYLHELEVLRAMVGKEDLSWSDSSWRGEMTKERYRRLRERYPEAYGAFESELWAQKGRDRRKIRTRRKLEPSPYIERKRRELPDSEEKDKYLRKLMNLKRLMTASRLGGVGYGGGTTLRGLRISYPEAYEAFQEELGRQAVLP